MNNEKPITVKPGLYRHFKGEYYFVQNIAKDAVRNIWVCYYFNVCHPEYGVFVRPVEEWNSTDTDKGIIAERCDNQTGQTHRFERVESINFQVSSISTEQLMYELRQRKDSPIRDLDLEGAESRVFSRDYVCGVPMYDELHGKYLSKWVQFDSPEEAKKHIKKYSMPGKMIKLFRRVLLEEDM